MTNTYCLYPDKHLKYHTTGCLMKAFRLAGSSISYRTLLRLEEKGNLKFPRSSTDFKSIGAFNMGKKLGAVRYLTEKEILEIVEAFLPGGSGFWKNE